MKYFPRLSVVIFSFVFSASLWAAASDGASGTNADTASAPIASDGEGGSSPSSELVIPGPLRSFLRMAGISQEIAPDDVLPLLSWNVSTMGYEGRNHATEYLILLTRYVFQARELATLAGNEGAIRVSGCGDAGPLLHILGYRIEAACGQPGTTLLTASPERAFLTIDSGFPLTDLEETLQGGKPFIYPFSSTRVPILFSAADWNLSSTRKNQSNDETRTVDTILSDRSVARLYWALSKMDPETRVYLRRKLGIRKLLDYSALLDFYGGHICIRHGRVLVPGGAEAASGWEELADASPSDPAEFVPKLLTKDSGWLAAYFDVLWSVRGQQQAYFTRAGRLQRFYGAMRPAKATSATSGVFRPAPWLFLLISQIQLAPNGEPLVPGGVEAWREILRTWKDPSRLVRYAEKRNIKSPEDLLDGMFAMSRDSAEDGPLQAYLALSQLSGRRPHGRELGAETVRVMCSKFSDFSDQYRIFSEFPELSDGSILLFLKIAEHLDKLPNHERDDALGIMQANVGIWQILARQNQISTAQLDRSWQNVIKPFERVRSPTQLYDAGRTSLAQVFGAATGLSAISQDEIVELLAGPRQSTPEGRTIHRELADHIRSVLDAQRLVSLDTLIAIDDGLKDKAAGRAPGEYLFHMADQLHEFQMPQPIFTNSERTEWAPTFYSTRHTDFEMKNNVGKILKSAKATPGQIDEARGELAPFLRDILVGLNYAYYEPPGAQALHVNPLFVRSHDFSGETVEGIRAVWQAPQLFGAGSPAGGGAHFVGSLADLPYALAELEQDFISPKNVQALIWQELVPTLLTSAVLPRWWNVSSTELHAAALYQRSGEELVSAAANDPQLQTKVTAILSDRMAPRHLESVEQGIKSGEAARVVAEITPAEAFYLFGEFQRRYPTETGSLGSAGKELLELQRQYPEKVSWTRLSHDFGIPHPTLSYSYANELLNVPPLPAYSGFASRLLAESWESSNLYWARLADEQGYSPIALNQLVPELTHQMIARIFATDLEDWPAVLRAMRETGDDFRRGRFTQLTRNAELRQ